MKQENNELELTTDEILKSINRKMTVLIALLVATEEEKNFDKEIKKINKLKEWGLENFEIAEILSKTPGQISDQLYNVKRKNKK